MNMNGFQTELETKDFINKTEHPNFKTESLALLLLQGCIVFCILTLNWPLFLCHERDSHIRPLDSLDLVPSMSNWTPTKSNLVLVPLQGSL